MCVVVVALNDKSFFHSLFVLFFGVSSQKKTLHSSVSFCCSSQFRVVRNALGFLVAGILTLMQATTFVVYGSSFCKEYNCTFSRGSATSLAALACYLLAGTGFFLSQDYPGVDRLNKAKELVTNATSRNEEAEKGGRNIDESSSSSSNASGSDEMQRDWPPSTPFETDAINEEIAMESQGQSDR